MPTFIVVYEYTQSEHIQNMDIKCRTEVEHKDLLVDHYDQIPDMNIQIWCPPPHS